VGERGDAAPSHALQVCLGEPCGEGALGLPVPPGDRGGGQALRAAQLGERVQVGVGGGVVALAGAAEGSRHRGVKDEVGGLVAVGQLGKRPAGVCLGGQDRNKALREVPLNGGGSE